ncbi:MAG: hypothetical protein M0C28_13220 [Candidatus Moduliflexus flocculans]|nr:hypothetical protein [Candidatus Moduliflexus flocculans]
MQREEGADSTATSRRPPRPLQQAEPRQVRGRRHRGGRAGHRRAAAAQGPAGDAVLHPRASPSTSPSGSGSASPSARSWRRSTTSS